MFFLTKTDVSPTLLLSSFHSLQPIIKYLCGVLTSYKAGRISIPKIINGHNSVKNLNGVTVLVFCTASDDALHCTKFRENILNDFKLNSGHYFHTIRIYIKGHNSIKM